MPADARERFLTLLREAVRGRTLVKLTLGRHRGGDASLRNIFARPVALKAGARLSLVWRHETRDVTKNHSPDEALALLEPLIGGDFLDAHLFTPAGTAQLECDPGGSGRLNVSKGVGPPPSPAAHDRPKARAIDPTAPWLCALGVTSRQGRPQEGMAAKFRQIQKFAELVGHLLAEAGLGGEAPLSAVDMGCGKGYLTFALAAVLGARARIRGIEARAELVDFCNRAAAGQGLAPRLDFTAGTIADTPLENTDVVMALHACDTATDDALARGIAAGAKLLMVAPCCQHELRYYLKAPAVLAGALQHGIFQERQAEFVTDALRAQLLEWSGYRTKVFEFVSTEHTAKNLMIAAIKARPSGDPALAAQIRAFAEFYGIKRQALARQLGFEL